MRIGILTFNQAINYGAVLQEYALYKVVCDLGHDCSVVNYQNKKFCKESNERGSNIRNRIKRAITLKSYWAHNKKRKFLDFINRNVVMSEPVQETSISQISPRFDIIITGSDQVFNLSLTGFDWNYYLAFLPEKKCVTYAASFGVNDIPAEWDRSLIRKYINRIPSLCVRENSGRNIIQSLCDRNAEVVLDPTLLLSKEQWEVFLGKNKVKHGYILVYTFESGDINAYAKKIASTRNLKIVKINASIKEIFDRNITICNDAGVEEFLSLIYYADMIITNSYHGMIFSVIFEKEFIVFPHRMNEQANDRMKDFLKRYGIIGSFYNNDLEFPHPVDYDLIRDKIEIDRKKSTNYLKSALHED